MLTAEERIHVFKEYLGQQVWIRNSYGNADEPEHRFGRLCGIQYQAILLAFQSGKGLWFNLMDENACYEFKLLLKPCSRLSPEVIEQAKALPVSGCIVPYYRSLGYDLPVFITPGHPENCKNVIELGLADYREPEDILTGSDYVLNEKQPVYDYLSRF